MESGDEDDAFTMGERDWQKMSRDLSKQGYRDGKNEGREKGMQESFEMATSLTLKYSMKLGQLQGLIEWQLSQANQMDDGLKREKLTVLHTKIVSLLGNFTNASNSTDNDNDGFMNEKNNLEQEWKRMFGELIVECVGICPDYTSIINSFQLDLK